MIYAKIENGTILELHTLSTKRRMIIVGGKKILNPVEANYIEAGWLKLVDQVIGADQVQTSDISDNGDGTCSYVVRDMTQQEIDDRLDSRIFSMDMAVRSYIDERIHSSAGPMIYEKAKASKVKSKAIKDWVEGLWLDYGQRKAQLIAGGTWDDAMTDFSNNGDIPYSPMDAMAE